MADQLDPVPQPTSDPSLTKMEPAAEPVMQDAPDDAPTPARSKECASCGEAIEASFLFCPKCGKDANAEKTAEADSDPSTPNMSSIISKVGDKENFKKILIGSGIALALAILAFLFATHTICFHDWKDATCLNAKRCAICKQVEGKPLGHDYTDATCTEPMTCKRCSETAGVASGHSVSEWIVDSEATCATEGQRHGSCATCKEEITEIVGKTQSHDIPSWVVTKEASCSSEGSKSGTCSVCGESKTESITKKDHNAGSWQTTGTPYISNGNTLYTKESVECTVCGTQIDSRNNETKLTMEQQNALNEAWDYLSVMPFSHSGLIKQLQYEGYSQSSAKFAADYCGADWYEQAAKTAQDYLNVMSFSRSELISQLKYEGFTQDQAEYGVKAVGY